MRRGPTPGAIYQLEGDMVAIGRGSKNDIIIHDNEVSREHCQLRRVMDDYEVHDLNSSNGTFINGQRVTEGWLLQTGAIVELGDTITLEYERPLPRRMTAPLPQRMAEPEMPREPQLPREPEKTTEQFPIPHYSLMVTMGPKSGEVHRLDNLIVTIGRDLSNDIVIPDPEVSRFHARLRRGNNGYSVEDMGSTNGTAVNGALIQQQQDLQADDVIRLARQVRLQYMGRSDAVKRSIEETMIAVKEPFNEQPEYANGQTAPLVLSSLRTTGNLRRTGLLGYAPPAAPTAPTTPQRQAGRLPGISQTGGLYDSLFVAYARQDWDKAVSPLIVSLDQAGVQSWIDQYLVPHGDDWRADLEQALSECWAIVVVVSAQSLSSNYVKMAYRYFAAQNKPLLAFILEPETTIPPDLTHGRSVIYDPANPQRSFHKLILEVMNLRK
jgi:pSer/pThr/pTyr-binding forkhead associated (FHA) protein